MSDPVTLSDASNTDVPLPVAAALFNQCYHTHPDAVVPVWEPAERYVDDLPPNRVGCLECGELVRIV